jgi:hypothetical protein
MANLALWKSPKFLSFLSKVTIPLPMKTQNCLSIYLILPAALGPGVDTASNGNEYQKMFLGNTGLPAPKADNLTAICEPIVSIMCNQQPTTVKASAACDRDNFTLLFISSCLEYNECLNIFKLTEFLNFFNRD